MARAKAAAVKTGETKTRAGKAAATGDKKVLKPAKTIAKKPAAGKTAVKKTAPAKAPAKPKAAPAPKKPAAPKPPKVQDAAGNATDDENCNPDERRWKLLEYTCNGVKHTFEHGKGRYCGKNPLQAARKAYNQLSTEENMAYNTPINFVMKQIGERHKKRRVYTGERILRTEPVVKTFKGKEVKFTHVNVINFIGTLEENGSLKPKAPKNPSAVPKKPPTKKSKTAGGDASQADPAPADAPAPVDASPVPADPSAGDAAPMDATPAPAPVVA